MKLVVKSKGLAAAEEQMQILANLGAVVKGVALNAATRANGTDSGQIIKYLAEGNSRSSKPALRCSRPWSTTTAAPRPPRPGR